MNARRKRVSRLESRLPQPNQRQLRAIMDKLFELNDRPFGPAEFYKVYSNRDNLESVDSDWARKIISTPGGKELFMEMVKLVELLDGKKSNG